MLLDTGSSDSHIKRTLVRKLHLKKDTAAVWDTAAGKVSTNQKCDINFALPEFFSTHTITWETHVRMIENINYDMIIGRDLLDYLGIDVCFSTSSIKWENAEIPMRSADATIADSFYIEDPQDLYTTVDRVKEILDAKYEPANLDEITKNCIHLNKNEQEKLNLLLRKYQHLFDGSLGSWNGDEYDIKLQPGARPYHA